LIKKIGTEFKELIYEATLKERSPHKLTISCCLGVFIAFSPYIGFHTLMIFLFSWLFSLNLALTFASTYLLNNPWTMVPLYAIDNFFGDWVLRAMFGINSHAYNPTWLTWVNDQLAHYTGLTGISFWGFMVGGNLLGIIFSVILYPILLVFFRRITKQTISQKSKPYHEDNNTEQKSIS